MSSEKEKDCTCKCYKDRRIWIMISVILFVGFVSSVFIFGLDIGPNIVYAFLIFWGIIFVLMGLGVILVIRLIKEFCKDKKEDRDSGYLVASTIILVILLIASLIIITNISENYNYWMIKAFGHIIITEKETPQEDCKILVVKTIKTKPAEDLWDMFDRHYYYYYEPNYIHSEEKTVKDAENCLVENTNEELK